MDIRECTDCQLPFEARSWNTMRCRECARLKKNETMRGIKARQAGPRPVVLCGYCGKAVPPERHRTARYCNLGCREKNRAVRPERIAYVRSRQPARTAYTREWRKNNPAQVRNGKISRREAESLGRVSDRDWRRLKNLYQGRCAYCGVRCRATMDHVVPLHRGGRHTIGNLLPACQSCNSKKHTKYLIEWKTRRAVAA